MKSSSSNSLFADVAHEHWVARNEAYAATLAPNAKLPILHKDQLALGWRSDAPLMSVGVRTELDEAAALFCQPSRTYMELGPGSSAPKH